MMKYLIVIHIQFCIYKIASMTILNCEWSKYISSSSIFFRVDLYLLDRDKNDKSVRKIFRNLEKGSWWLKEYGTVENHVADYRERFFEPGTARHNPFSAENFPYHIYSDYLTPFFFHFSFSSSPFTTFPTIARPIWRERKGFSLIELFLFSLHPLAFSIHLQIPPPLSSHRLAA